MLSHSSQPAAGQPGAGQATAPPLRALPADSGPEPDGQDSAWQDGGLQDGDSAYGWQDGGWAGADWQGPGCGDADWQVSGSPGGWQNERLPPHPEHVHPPVKLTARPAAVATPSAAEGAHWAGYAEEPPERRPAAHAGQPKAGNWISQAEEPPHADWASQADQADWASQADQAAAGGERLAMLCYLSVPFLLFLVPLLTYLLCRRRSGFIRWHAAQALSLSLTVVLYAVCTVIVAALLALDSVGTALTITAPITLILWLLSLGFLVRAAVAASRGQQARIPGWLCATIVR